MDEMMASQAGLRKAGVTEAFPPMEKFDLAEPERACEEK